MVTEWKVFELDTGCTDWIVAETSEQALNFYQSMTGLSDEDMENISSTEITYDKLEKYKYYGERDENGDESNFKKEFDRLVESNCEIPIYFASSEV